MTKSLSQDLRAGIVRAVAVGSSVRKAAIRFEVSASATIKLMQRVRATGARMTPGKVGGHRRPLLVGHEAVLRELTEAKPGITLAEIKVALAERGIEAGHISTIWAPSAGSACRTKKTLRAAEQDRPDVDRARCRWRVWQRFVNPDRFVFLNEIGSRMASA